MRYLSLACLLVSLGCGIQEEVTEEPIFPDYTEPNNNPANYTEVPMDEETKVELGVFLEDFNTLLEHYQVTPPIAVERIFFEFDDLSSTSKTAAAKCAITIDLVATITIDERHWNGYNEWQRETVVFHELGHCSLIRDHEKGWNTEEVRPDSLMYPNIIPSDIYAENSDYYREELFSKLNTWEAVTEAIKEKDTGTRDRPTFTLN